MTAINEWAHIPSDNYWCLCKIPLDTSLLLEQETTIPHQKQTKMYVNSSVIEIADVEGIVNLYAVMR